MGLALHTAGVYDAGRPTEMGQTGLRHLVRGYGGSLGCRSNRRHGVRQQARAGGVRTDSSRSPPWCGFKPLAIDARTGFASECNSRSSGRSLKLSEM